MLTKKKFIIYTFIVPHLFLLFSAAPSFSVNIGDPFPSFSVPNNMSPDDCFNLGVAPGGYFAIDDMTQECIIIEFLNVYCHTCRMQVKIYNDLFVTVEKDPVLSEKVSIMGVAVGNSPEEVNQFRKDFGVLYPVLADPQKEIFNLTGHVHGTPHTYILKKEKKHFIIDYHAGEVSSKDRYLATIRLSLSSSLSGIEPGNKVPGYSFISGNKFLDENSFIGKKVILYFPVNKRFPLEMDIRNPEKQLESLHEITRKFQGINVVLFKHPGFSMDLQERFESPSFYFGKPSDKKTFDTFASTGKPSIYYINPHGRIAFKGDAITLFNAQSIFEEIGYKPESGLEEDEIISLIQSRITKLGKKPLATEKIMMDNGEEIYVTTLSPKQEGKFLFSRLESETSLCDVCHDSHFILIIDQDGKILDFVSVLLTKLDNVSWSEQDEKKIKDLVAGKNIFNGFPFNPGVDAVSTATMTTSLVFESLNHEKDIFEKFSGYNFRRQHWKEECFRNMCRIKQEAEKKKNINSSFVLNDAELKKLTSKNTISGCPLGGLLLVLDGDILCSIHGFNAVYKSPSCGAGSEINGSAKGSKGP